MNVGVFLNGSMISHWPEGQTPPVVGDFMIVNGGHAVKVVKRTWSTQGGRDLLITVERTEETP